MTLSGRQRHGKGPGWLCSKRLLLAAGRVAAEPNNQRDFPVTIAEIRITYPADLPDPIGLSIPPEDLARAVWRSAEPRDVERNTRTSPDPKAHVARPGSTGQRRQRSSLLSLH